jgi:hypothetical protein
MASYSGCGIAALSSTAARLRTIQLSSPSARCGSGCAQPNRRSPELVFERNEARTSPSGSCGGHPSTSGALLFPALKRTFRVHAVGRSSARRAGAQVKTRFPTKGSTPPRGRAPGSTVSERTRRSDGTTSETASFVGDRHLRASISGSTSAHSSSSISNLDGTSMTPDRRRHRRRIRDQGVITLFVKALLSGYRSWATRRTHRVARCPVAWKQAVAAADGTLLRPGETGQSVRPAFQTRCCGRAGGTTMHVRESAPVERG